MFCDCQLLTSLDLSNFNTNNVKYMRSMFDGCQSLTELNLSNWNMDKIVTTVSGGTSNIFANCNSLHILRLDNCNTDTISKIIDNLPTKAIEGVTRTIYCKRVNAEGLTAPTNWVFSYID